MRRKMPKIPTNKQLANIKKRSTERMVNLGWIMSAGKETGRRYLMVPRRAKSRKPLPEGWPAYAQVRGQIVELPERLPKNKRRKIFRQK